MGPSRAVDIPGFVGPTTSFWYGDQSTSKAPGAHPAQAPAPTRRTRSAASRRIAVENGSASAARTIIHTKGGTDSADRPTKSHVPTRLPTTLTEYATTVR